MHKNQQHPQHYFCQRLNLSRSLPLMIPTNAKKAASTAPAPANHRTVLLAHGRSLTIRVALTPAGDLREGRNGPASRHPRPKAGTRKAALTASHELGRMPPPMTGIAKDSAAQGRRRSGRRWKRKARQAAAAVAVAAATAAAQDVASRPPAACAGSASADSARAAAASPPLDDLLCELRDMCL